MSDSNMLANACQQRAVSLSVVNHEVSQPQINNNNKHLVQLFRQGRNSSDGSFATQSL